MKSLSRIILYSIVAGFFLIGCASSSDSSSGDDTPTVTLKATSALKNSTFGVGCYIESNTSYQCICFENGTNYTESNHASSNYCTNLVGDVTLTAENTKLTDQTAGDHNSCSTNDPNALNNFCETADAATSVVTVEADGEHILTFDINSRSF